MKQNDRVELILKDGDKAIGYYQYTERGTIFLSPFSHGMQSWGTMKEDIKEIREV